MLPATTAEIFEQYDVQAYEDHEKNVMKDVTCENDIKNLNMIQVIHVRICVFTLALHW